jgi:predicted RNase H-like HicB family nuclease
MKSRFTLQYWRDGKFYVGRLLEVPGVASQGETMDELRDNIQDAYDLMVTQSALLFPAQLGRNQSS